MLNLSPHIDKKNIAFWDKTWLNSDIHCIVQLGWGGVWILLMRSQGGTSCVAAILKWVLVWMVGGFVLDLIYLQKIRHVVLRHE
jgi:hypothetical protein